MTMYKTILEAVAIFDSLDPASVHEITEDVSKETMTGTPAEVEYTSGIDRGSGFQGILSVIRHTGLG